MALLAREDLRALADGSHALAVSIYMPTHRGGRDTREDPIRFKNMLRQAENEVVELLDPKRAAEFLKPAKRFLEDPYAWRHASDGLAMFLSPDMFKTYQVPYPFEEMVTVTEHFHLKPLLPIITDNGRFYVLAISQNKVRMFMGTQYNVSEVELADIPNALEELVRRDDESDHVQWHSEASGNAPGARRHAVFHGQGAAGEDKKKKLDILRFFQRIDRAVCDLLANEKAPLVLACVEYYVPLYREANKYPHLLDQHLNYSPDEARPEQLQQDAWKLVEPIFTRRAHEELQRYGQFAARDMATTDLGRIISSAMAGRVHAMFVAKGVQCWGKYDHNSHQIELHEKRQEHDLDLIDFAAAQGLLNGSQVFSMEQNQIPKAAPIAAMFRY